MRREMIVTSSMTEERVSMSLLECETLSRPSGGLCAIQAGVMDRRYSGVVGPKYNARIRPYNQGRRVVRKGVEH